jgi:hypothetical protein
MKKNRFGLARKIPNEIQRKVRENSKFACVVCRSGIYQYEHIDPLYSEAKKHDSEKICCLCASCHDLVTKGQYSKDYIKQKYNQVRSSDSVAPPRGPIDFHTSNAELLIGGLLYPSSVTNIVKYNNIDVIKVEPGKNEESGKISALFTDDNGFVTLKLINNIWQGSLKSWDIQIEGQSLFVRTNKGKVVLKIRIEPPGRIVIERLNMRFKDVHLLITEKAYAVGRYTNSSDINWVTANIQITKSSYHGTAIEFTDPKELEKRDKIFKGKGMELEIRNREVVFSSINGVMVKPLGISIASFCGSFKLYNVGLFGVQTLDKMKDLVFYKPDKMCEFLQEQSINAKNSSRG